MNIKEITLNRLGRGQKADDIATVGRLTVDDISICSIEDDYDEVKEYGHTRIPAGRYEIKLRKWGTHNDKYAIRFNDIHKGMLEICNVPNYKDILIHCGLTEKDTAGCVCVGLEQISDHEIKFSSKAYRKFYPIPANHLIEGEQVFINIID
jgi:hypothetical protein